MSDDLLIRVHGYAAASGTIDREKWESMDRAERRSWSMDLLNDRGSPTDVTTALAEIIDDHEYADGEFHSEEEW